MKLLDELIEELTEIAAAYNKDEISQEELSIQLELMKPRIESLAINYYVRPLSYLKDKGNHVLMDQLLYKAKFKCLEAISMLQGIDDDKRSFNAKLRYVLAARLYFKSLELTMKRSLAAYNQRNDFKNTNLHLQILIREGIAENE